MTAEEFLDKYGKQATELGLPFGREDMLGWMADSSLSAQELDTLSAFLSAMVRKKDETAVCTLKRLSRIPQKSPLTFGNFNMDLLNEHAKRQVRALQSLSFVSSKRNVIMVGPPGTGKTHLAMAIGNECCRNKIKMNITVRRSRLSGVARATCPDKRSHLKITFHRRWT